MKIITRLIFYLSILIVVSYLSIISLPNTFPGLAFGLCLTLIFASLFEYQKNYNKTPHLMLIITAYLLFLVFLLFINAQILSPAWNLAILSMLIIIGLMDSIFRLREYEKTIAPYDEPLTMDPNDTIALNNKGTSLAGLIAHRKEALECFNKVLKIDPNDAAALHNKGVILDKMGEHREALEYYDKALELDPGFEKAKNLGKVILEA